MPSRPRMRYSKRKARFPRSKMTDGSTLSRYQRVAFLGLGKMGQPMARRLHEAGAPVLGFDPVEAARRAFVEAGGVIAATAREAAQGADILITMLPDGKAVRAALVEREPLVEFLAKDAIIIDMSSSAPVGTRELANELAGRGVHLIDAPVSGGV